LAIYSFSREITPYEKKKKEKKKKREKEKRKKEKKTAPRINNSLSV